MADDFKYDVFVSYNSANKDWVRKKFIPILENAGLIVCDYYRDFDVGAPIVMEMERAILESRKTIPILSPAYLKSGWTEFESLMLQTLDAANRERRLLPVILESCDLPLRISYMNCINFANPDDVEIEWQRLSRALGVTLSSTTTSKTSTTDDWHLAHPYPMPPNFTGRVAEQKMLDDWLADDKDRLFILRALGGFGKSALSWQWINTQVNPAEWTKLVFWSFYEGDASFEHFIEETLKYLKIEIPQGGRLQVDKLFKAMQSQKILLIMDGFERLLRAYSSMNAAYQGDEESKPEDNQLDCVNINIEIFLKSICSLPNIKSKVLMTTRLTPRIVRPRGEFMLGCREEELTAIQKADAFEFFYKQKIKGTHAEIEAACAPYGYHPLSLRLLAGRILKDFENPADIVVAQKLKIDGDLKQQKHHVLEFSYNSLLIHEQKLLSTIACFRSPVELKTLQSINEDKDTLDNDLQDLVARGLLHFDDKNKKFDLHPIVRRFAYNRLTITERTDTHKKLVDYFDAIPKPEKMNSLDDLAPVIELYHHTVRTGELEEAYKLFFDRLIDPLYNFFNSGQLVTELLYALFADEKNDFPQLSSEDHQGGVLNILASVYCWSGQPRTALTFFERCKAIAERLNNKNNAATVLGNMAYLAQFPIGNLRMAVLNLQKSIEMKKEVENARSIPITRQELGRILIYLGKWDEALKELKTAETEFDALGKNSYISRNYNCRASRILFMARASEHLNLNEQKSAIKLAQHALKLAEEWAKLYPPVENDFMNAYWKLGAAYRLNERLDLAEQNLSNALMRNRNINMVQDEAEILLDIARLRYDQKNYEEAKTLADEALTITERCGYVLQGADVNLFLAQYALEQEKDAGKAKEYAESALKLAYCDGPPYFYKVAYEEAERMLEKLK